MAPAKKPDGPIHGGRTANKPALRLSTDRLKTICNALLTLAVALCLYFKPEKVDCIGS